MKILLVSNYLPDNQASMLRYAWMLERELRKRGHQTTVVYPQNRLLAKLEKLAPLARFSKWIAYVDKYLLSGSYLREQARHVDIVHVCDHSNSMYLRLAGQTPSIITCHDLLAVFAARGEFAGIHVGSTGQLLQRWISANLLRAREVICVSFKTQDDLARLGAGHPPKSVVIHHPLHWDFHPVSREETRSVLSASGLSGVSSYLLHIGSNSWYKNRPAVVRIFAMLKRSPAFAQTRLILAGKPWDAELRALVRESGVAEDIVELNEISDEQLRALYSGAVALLFPSRHEGFGWPILEAQASGCPVITTDRAPMTEVAGDAAILIDPDRPEDAAATILAQLDRLPELSTAGLENVKRFSIDAAMDAYVAAYEDAIASQSAPAAGARRA